MLEGTLGREVTNKELFEILGKVFEVEEGTGVNKEQIGAILQRGSKGGVTRDHSRENRER